MALPNAISWLHCIGVGLLLIGLILHIVGLATPNWATISVLRETLTLGLWKSCVRDICFDLLPDYSMADILNATRAFAIMAMLAGVKGLGLACLHIVRCIQARPETQILRLGTLAAGITALVCVIISCSVYGAGIHKKEADTKDIHTGFSLILSAVGGVTICVGSVIFYVACLMKS
ncbi:epithelial membrane protein 1 [Biomphalaria glabrata]|uniref:Claudin n=1 Tax=Biomphalaria glabrata TaxID=6526 RepID=A0A2C9LMH8_BIOGL|nr:epithelial membrane protein 1 [Biomphalaria glabrata]